MMRGGRLRLGWRAYAWVALLAGVVQASSPASAEVEMRFELPRRVDGAEALWAATRDGQVLAEGSFECISGGDAGAKARVMDGSATLWVTINQDDYRSWYPSFGDLYVRRDFEVIDGDASLEVGRSNWRQRKAGDPEEVVTVHYHRYDGEYPAAGLWTWDERETRQPDEQETFVVGRDDFGVIFQVDAGRYGGKDDRIGLLPRLRGSWEFKDGPDRYWSPESGREVYIVESTGQVFATRPDVSPKLTGATIEEPDKVAVRLTHSLPVSEFPAGRFVLREKGGAAVALNAVKPGARGTERSNTYILKTAGPLAFLKRRYLLEVDGLGSVEVTPGGVLSDPRLFHDPDAVLGAQYDKKATRFAVFSPMAESVEVVIADRAAGGEPQAFPMTANDKGVWSVSIPGDLKGKFYAYRLSGPGLDPSEEVTDIYAVCTQARAPRAMIVDLEETDPEKFDPAGYVKCASPTDAVIYELHVRDFTIADSSGVQNKGKYLGLTESGTRMPDDESIRTGLDHLVELGVTHVQIMPVQDFDNAETPDDPYNWGYMPVFYNSPDGWYARRTAGSAKIREFKRVVQALHDRGIGVIMDVVYNHAHPGRSTFENLAPGYYFRRRPDGSLWNGSGCGNEFASERPMARKFMVDSRKFWVREYGIDGFRFDLMGLHDLETMLQIERELRKINPHVLVYGEPWTGGASGLAQITDKNQVAGTPVGAFNDHFRDAIKGDRDAGAPGFIQTGDRIERIRQGVRGAIDDWAQQPTDCITYAACHDNLTVWDKILQSAPDAPPEVKERMQRFAGLLVLTSQGTSFLHSGQELCRTKGGSHNSYNLPDSVNRIDWSWKKEHRGTFDYYCGLIALRKAHPAFRLSSASDVRRRQELRRMSRSDSDNGLAYVLEASGVEGESAERFLVLFNGDKTSQPFRIPEGIWQVLVNADSAGTEPLEEATEMVVLPAHSGMVLMQ